MTDVVEPPPKSALQRSGEAADEDFRAEPASASTLPCKKKTWVEVRLIDPDGKPVPHEDFRLELPDGRIIEGKLDENGLAGVEDIDPGSDGTLTFPNLDRLSAELVG